MKFKMAFSRMALEGKIPPGDPMWGKFNASFQNTEMDITEIANEIYTAHPFTTWHSNNWRNSANYQLGQHIGIDFDTEDERSSLPYLAKDKFIQKYAAFIYTTPSHTPSIPSRAQQADHLLRACTPPNPLYPPRSMRRKSPVALTSTRAPCAALATAQPPARRRIEIA
jgi:hypothetical protein